MEVDSDAVNDYKSSLNDLTINSKPQINMLTMLAEDYKDTKSVEIVRCIEQRIHTVSRDRMLPLLYLLDSICKNVGEVYTKLFTQNIVSTFCDVFEKVDEKTRLSLYKLRQTWNTIFPVRKLYAIDLRIHQQLDPAWPITAKPDEPSAVANSNSNSNSKSNSNSNSTNSKTATVKSSVTIKPQQQVHVNPRFLSDAKHAQIGITQSSLVSPEADPWLAKQIIQKQQELLQLQKVKLENEVIKKQHELEVQARALQEKEQKLKQKEKVLQRSNSPNGKNVKKRKRSRSRRSRSPSPITQKNRSPIHGWNRSPTDRIRESPSGLNRQQSPSFSMRPSGNAYSPHRHRSRSPNMLKNQYIAQQSSASLASHQTSALLPTPSQPHVPTTIPAPTILAQPEMLSITSIASSHSEQNSVQTINSIRSIPSNLPVMHHNIHSNLQSNVNTNTIDRSINSAFLWGQDRDYRKEFDSMMTEAQEKLRTGAISSADHDVLVREMKRAINESHSNHVPTILKAPDSVSMLIDRKSRQLFYLDNTTAIVLLGAPDSASFEQLIQIDPKLLDPRQIRLEGPPTKVFIDSDRGSNDFILLEFNGMEKIFYHYDNEQRIRFGVPAKEIIFNGQPYPAKFGGAPIEVYFKGDNLPHSLKLDQTSSVRVKLSDERCYDLWAKVVKIATSDGTNKTPLGQISAQKPSDVNNLISKLIAAGIITNNGGSTSSQQNLPKDEQFEQKEEKQPIDPPIKLSSDSLKINRATVIATLYNGIQCTNCSLRFDDKDQPISSDKTRYSKHLDWHFRQNRRDKVKPSSSINSSTKRNWYYPLNLWCQYKEVTYEDDSTSLFVTEENESDEDQETPLPTVVADKDESLNCCAVCAEKFEQQWNEDEEEWKLINANIHNEKIYHPSCLTDYITQHERTTSDNEINEQFESKTKINFISDNIEKPELEKTEPKLQKHELVVEDLPFIASYCDNMVIDSVNNDIDVNNQMSITDKMNEQIISDSNVIPFNNEKETINSEPYIEEAKIQVYEYEIPLNNNNNSEVVDQNIQHSTECDKLVFSVEQTKEDVIQSHSSLSPTIVKNDANPTKVVPQQGAIVIKMKSSNIQQQITSQTVKDEESLCNDEPQITVKGHELSSLCSIM